MWSKRNSQWGNGRKISLCVVLGGVFRRGGRTTWFVSVVDLVGGEVVFRSTDAMMDLSFDFSRVVLIQR